MTPTAWYFAKLAGFSALPLVPALVVLGHYTDVCWLVPALTFLGIPLLDLLIGADKRRPLLKPPQRVAILWLRNIPRLYAFLRLGMLAWATRLLSSEAPGTSAAWLIISAAVATAFATCVAHELLHWPSAFGLSRLITATVAYGTFTLEHLHHHAMVGVPSEGTTPPVGQSLWTFVRRNIIFTMRCAWRIERRRQLATRLPLSATGSFSNGF